MHATCLPDEGEIARALDDEGYAVCPPILEPGDRRRIRRYYEDPSVAFRSTIDMTRYSFGRGEYRYFDYPLPADVAELRAAWYAALAAIANEWSTRLGESADWPASLDELLERCHRQGQRRPTPLLLRYRAGDYNCLHQDLYGPIHFPLQVIVPLSAAGEDYDGGELILVEQRPRMQSRPIIVRAEPGSAVVIPVRERPRRGTRGWHRAVMRHGVGRVLAGERFTLGLIFHDAA